VKVCSKCNLEKETIEFAKSGRREGLFASLCKPCSSKKSSEWNKKNPEKRRAASRRNKLKTQYGLTVEQFESMILSQNSRCLICDAARKLVVDHCHKTGKIRGLLCNSCNRGIGYLQDNWVLLNKASNYVIKNS
jgi:hypothetical protein